MCELFAASLRHASRVTMSLETFADRGGMSGPHRDGWGVAFYDGRDCLRLREACPAAESTLAAAVRARGVRSNLVISHIRLATSGEVALHNTHPFARELGGRVHTFAHNGNLPGCRTDPELAYGSARPIGSTDSEHAFCALLRELAPLWLAPDVPPLESRRAVVERFAARLRTLGPANFIYSDADFVYAHADRRTQTNGRIEPPGLWTLSRACDPDLDAVPGCGFDTEPRPEQTVVLFASIPLTQEPWRPLERGEVVVARGGVVSPRPSPARSPH